MEKTTCPVCGFFTPNDPVCMGASDSESIQNAVDAASRCGVGKVVIPAVNARTGECRWNVDRAILLPDHIHVVLDNAYLRQTDGSMDNVFRNAGMYAPEWLTPAGEQTDIRLSGIGTAVIDGGVPNGLTQGTSEKNGFPHVRFNNPILLHNVRNFSVENLIIRNQRWWGMNLCFCTDGRLSDITFEADDSILNQDGIDLRIGCQRIIVERIRGQAGDDLIALSGFLGGDKKLAVEGKSIDIRDILIRDVMGTSVSKTLVALRNHDGCVIRDITIDNIHDTSVGSDANHPYAVVRIGQKMYSHTRRSEPGETSNIHISNIHAHAYHGILINVTLTESVIRGIFCDKNVICAVTTHVGEDVAEKAHIRNIVQGAFIRNTVIEDIFCEPGGESDRAVVELARWEDCDGEENVTVRNIYAAGRRDVYSDFDT